MNIRRGHPFWGASPDFSFPILHFLCLWYHELVFTDREYTFKHRELMFTGREHKLLHNKETFL